MSSTSAALSRRSSSSASSRLLALPTSVVVSILSFLPLPSLTCASSICALLFVLTQDDRLWRPLCLRRWRPLLPYVRFRLLPKEEWAQLDKSECEEEADEEGNEAAVKEDRCPTAVVAVEADDGPTFPQSGGWKLRYICAEMDLCRSYMSLSELLHHKWRFRFHFGFDDGHNASFPVFTAQGRVRNRGDEWYGWRWVDRERPAGDEEEATAYERRRLIGRDTLRRQTAKPRPYWLRSSTTTKEATAVTDVPSPSPGALQLRASSALLSPSLPPHRYKPGHPFFAPTALQLRDVTHIRQLQINQFPHRTITRLQDGGWQMLNQYILMVSVHPDHVEEEVVGREEGDGEDDFDDDAVWMLGGMDVDVDVNVEDDGLAPVDDFEPDGLGWQGRHLGERR